MEAANDVRVLCEWLEMLAGGFEFLVIPGDEKEQALVGGRDVEAELECGEIRDCGAFVFAPIFFGNGVEGAREISSKNLSGSTSASSQAFFAIRGKDAEGGVFKSSVEMAADNFLSLFAFVGVDANTDKVAARFNNIFLGVLTVRRVSVAGSEDSGNPTTL